MPGIRHRPQDRQIIYGAEISVRMAVLERWYTKSGSKWQTMPRQMLIYRAASFFQRAYCPEIGMGFHTTEEEIDRAPEVIDAEATPMPAARKSLTDIAATAAAINTEQEAATQTAPQSGTERPSEAQSPNHPGEAQPDQPSSSKKTLL